MKSNIELDRRKVLGAAGGLALTGSGLAFFGSGSAAAMAVNIGANNPAWVRNDRGDLSRVTTDPTFRIEWKNLDEAVGKVFTLVEADAGSGYSPIFRMTPWLTEGSVDGVTHSKPGTSGYFELVKPLSHVLAKSTAARGDSDPRSLPRSLEIVNEQGRPDYEGVDWGQYGPSSSVDDYLNGTSMGSADEVQAKLDAADGDLSDNVAELPLVNNFPGADSGYYGAADDTSALDSTTDGKSNVSTVTLRYTFALYTVNDAMLGDGTPGEGWYSNLEASDVQQDSQGNSLLVMNGEDGYPDVTNNGAGSAAENDYDALQTIAKNHPTVVTETASFKVKVKNQKADVGATGQSNTGAQ